MLDVIKICLIFLLSVHIIAFPVGGVLFINFIKEFSYNIKDNKFELVRYQDEIKNNLINKIIEDIILYMNI